MKLDELILIRVCSFLDDPKSYFNFAVTCKIFYDISKTFESIKKVQFAMITKSEFVNYKNQKARYEIQTLPNGTYHGFYKEYINDYLVRDATYRNGLKHGLISTYQRRVHLFLENSQNVFTNKVKVYFHGIPKSKMEYLYVDTNVFVYFYKYEKGNWVGTN